MNLSEFISKYDNSPKGGKIFISSAEPDKYFYPKLIHEYLTFPILSPYEVRSELGVRERRLTRFAMIQYRTFPTLVNELASILIKNRSPKRQELVLDRLDYIK
jgi:hypothetical protein